MKNWLEERGNALKNEEVFMTLVDFLVEKGISQCKTECKRIIVQNQISVNGQRTDCFVTELFPNDVVTVVTPKMFRVLKVV